MPDDARLDNETHKAKVEDALRKLGEAITKYFNTPEADRTIPEVLRCVNDFNDALHQ